MSSQENQNRYGESNSVVLDLEKLTKKYQNLLIEYQQAVADYANYISAENSEKTLQSNQMVKIPGSVYWGTDGITQNNSSTLNECKASCIETTGCVGATFNSADYEQPMCWLRSGVSQVSVGKEHDYAIIKKGQYLLSTVQGINKKLLEVNKQISEKTEEGQPLYTSNSQESQEQNVTLEDKYKQLMRDRAKIASMMNEYQTLDEQQNNGNIEISQNYYSYILYLGLAISAVYALYKYSSPSNVVSNVTSNVSSGFNPFYIIFGIIVFILIVNFLVNRYS